jgi:tRNA (guanosine-2'-O-)-methyltransferase
MKTNKLVTQGSHKWVEKTHIKHENRLNFLKQKQIKGYQIVATALDDSAISYSDIDYTKPTVIILGNEKDGVNKEIIKIADKKIIIPMVGMAQSLNVSVAAAVILFEAKRQRENAKMYNKVQLSKQEYEKIYNKWIKREGLLKRIKGRADISLV